jgi:MFS family permease
VAGQYGITRNCSAALTGPGYPLVYPGLGVEADRGTTPKNRGFAMGLYTAFLDVAMAVGSPTPGWVGGHAGSAAIFLVSVFAVLCTVGVTVPLISRPSVRMSVQPRSNHDLAVSGTYRLPEKMRLDVHRDEVHDNVMSRFGAAVRRGQHR